MGNSVGILSCAKVLGNIRVIDNDIIVANGIVIKEVVSNYIIVGILAKKWSEYSL